MDDPQIYLEIVTLGFILTVIVGVVLAWFGQGFLKEVFQGNKEAARSVTILLLVGFYLVSLGFLALISTWDPIAVDNTTELVVTKLGGVLLFLGLLQAGAMVALVRARNNQRVQRMAANLRSGGGRRPAGESESTKGIGTS